MQLWLLEAARDDLIMMVIQIEELKAFLVQVPGSSGKRPTSLTWEN